MVKERVFLGDTATNYLRRAGLFRKVADEFNLIPVVYVGLKTADSSSRTACEMRDDLLTSKAAFIFLGEPTQLNNLALSIVSREAAYLLARVFFYCEPSICLDAPLKSYEKRSVETPEDFERFLRQDIKALT